MRRRGRATRCRPLALDLPFGMSWPSCVGRADDMIFGDAAGLLFTPDHERAIAQQVDHARHAARDRVHQIERLRREGDRRRSASDPQPRVT